MYLATYCRIDITRNLPRFFDRCTEEHVQAAMRVLRYLKSCPSLGITYKSGSRERTMVFSDADFASDATDRKSTSGTLICRQGAPVVWHSTKQSNVAQSSTESEFVSASESLKAALWIKELLTELEINDPITIYMDSQSAISLIRQPQYYRRTKHIEIKYLAIRDHYEKGDVNIEYVSTHSMRSDFLTKPCKKPTFQKQKQLAALETWEQRQV